MSWRRIWKYDRRRLSTRHKLDTGDWLIGVGGNRMEQLHELRNHPFDARRIKQIGAVFK